MLIAVKRIALNFGKAFCRSSIGKLLITMAGAALGGGWGLVLAGLAALLVPRMFPQAFASKPARLTPTRACRTAQASEISN